MSNLGFAHFGNGITVYDRTKEDKRTNDYVNVAFIDNDRNIKILDKKLSENDLIEIKHYSMFRNPTISITQDNFVFNEVAKQWTLKEYHKELNIFVTSIKQVKI